MEPVCRSETLVLRSTRHNCLEDRHRQILIDFASKDGMNRDEWTVKLRTSHFIGLRSASVHSNAKQEARIKTRVPNIQMHLRGLPPRSDPWTGSLLPFWLVRPSERKEQEVLFALVAFFCRAQTDCVGSGLTDGRGLLRVRWS